MAEPKRYHLHVKVRVGLSRHGGYRAEAVGLDVARNGNDDIDALYALAEALGGDDEHVSVHLHVQPGEVSRADDARKP